MHQQPDIDKIFLYAKDLFDVKVTVSLKKAWKGLV